MVNDNIVLTNMDLVEIVVAKLVRTMPSHVERSELVAEGMVGLVRAAQRFDPSRKVKFRTYASKLIRGAILESIRRKDMVPRYERDKEKRDGIAPKPGTPVSLTDIREPFVSHRGFASVDDRDELEKLMECLSPREKQVISVWLEGEAEQVAIGRKLGITGSCVSAHFHNALKKMRGNR